MTSGSPLRRRVAPGGVAKRLEEIWHDHRSEIFLQVDALQLTIARLLEDRADAGMLAAATGEAHKLAGSTGTLGFPEGSRLARSLELSLGRDPKPEQAHELAGLLADLRRVLEGDPVIPTQRIRPAQKAGPILLLSDDAALCTEIAALSLTRGLSTLIAGDAEELVAAIADDRSHVAVLDIPSGRGAYQMMRLLKDLSRRTPPIPAVVLSAKSDFSDRLEVARLGGRAFLHKPLGANDVIDAAMHLANRLSFQGMKVLAVDDNPPVLEVLRSALEPLDVEVITLEDPLLFWHTLEETAPDLLVLDVDMPHLNGMELCRVVRNEPRWADLPVLFLTAHSDPGVVQKLFAAGADDYVAKPILGTELVNRIGNRLERVRLFRMLADTDGLTGVATRRRSVDVMTTLSRLADRYGQPLSVILLDLDHFKSINDRHGHDAGDEVLRRLGSLLLTSFRGEDVVARWGGEEFFVGTYAMSKGDALRRMQNLLTLFAQERFLGSHGEFSVSFSAGVAEYPRDGTDLRSLYRFADAALYSAKLDGRGLVAATDFGTVAVKPALALVHAGAGTGQEGSERRNTSGFP